MLLLKRRSRPLKIRANSSLSTTTELINVEREIDLNVKDQKITEVLNNIFEGRDVEITVIDRKIVLAPTFMGEQQPTKKITGKVTDQSGASLPGVSVAVKGTTIGVITDPNGTYSILNIPENATLLFSFVGMKMQEIVVENKTTINVVLEEETVGIGEVVAIGYGTQTKREISGSVTNVTAKDFNKGVVANAADLLQGKVAGLNITKGSGDVTNGSTIRLRELLH